MMIRWNQGKLWNGGYWALPERALDAWGPIIYLAFHPLEIDVFAFRHTNGERLSQQEYKERLASFMEHEDWWEDFTMECEFEAIFRQLLLQSEHFTRGDDLESYDWAY